MLLDQLELALGVAAEAVQRDDDGQAVVLADVVDVAIDVRHALHQRVRVLAVDVLDLGAARVLQRARRADEHRGARAQARLAALDVDELLGAQVGAEAGFRDDVVGELERRLRRDDGVAAVRDVRERTAVHERRRLLERLHEVRLERFLHEHRHRALRVQRLGTNRLVVARVADDDLLEPVAHVVERRRQAEDRHDLRCGDDVVARLARETIGRAAQAVDDVSASCGRSCRARGATRAGGCRSRACCRNRCGCRRAPRASCARC